MPDEHSKRQRVSKACEQCRRKKVKCDGAQAVCSNCVSLGLPCTYKESTKKRGPPKGYIEAIEGRLHRLEALLGSIIQEDDPRSQAILAELNAPLETAYGELVRPRPARKDGFDDQLHPSNEAVLHDAPSISSINNDDEHMPQASSNEENANETLGNLSIDESGQLRYYGKSSGFYMLRGSKNFQNGAFHFNSRGYHRTKRPDGQKVLPNPLAVDPFELPPPDLSKHLLDLYFTHFYPLLPLLHKKSFLASLEPNQTPPPPLLLNAIYCVASRISPDVRVRSDPALRDTAGDIFLERAQILLDFEWDDFRVSTVQSLLLLSSHQNGALKNIRGWLYSGLAFRMCQNLGLNRNCDTWNLSDAEKEERKRVFYCSFVVDRLTCAMHGRAPMIDARDLDAPYPSEVDEDDKNNKPTIIEDFHQLIKLCEILGEILCQLYMVKGRKQIAMMDSPDAVISKLDRALNKWMAKLPACLQYRPPNTRMAEKAPAPKLEICQIHMLFYTSLILLHRPFIPGPTQTGTPSVFPSASICTFAANKILDIVECLMAEGRLKNVNNYALYFMFTAGIIFINDALSSDSMFAFEAKISINKIIRAMDEVETTWITSARHCNILGELAGLRDINLENVDEGYNRPASTSDTLKPPEALSIAVPNSPIMPLNNDAPPPSPLEFRNPIDAQRGTEHKFPEYLTQYVNNMPVSIKNDSVTDAPYSKNNNAASAQSTPLTYNTTPPNNNYASTPTNRGENAVLGYASGDRPFDPIGTAFWGVPMSFDIDEWNSYFSNQNFRSQQQQQDQPPQNSNEPLSAMNMNQSEPSQQQQTQLQLQQQYEQQQRQNAVPQQQQQQPNRMW
ncbi:nucleus protein [Mucor ambiguus]|uniref:Nucleus protein n=1 Tax=Mucor ambiguus TaxID=91626 RepID=A0A0C9MID0_9FUNG|nr:nucleus protein [Mucor ambiguus]